MFFLILPLMGLVFPPPTLASCPTGYYLADPQCIACTPCLPPLETVPPCGPGPEPGSCVGGIQVAVSISGAVSTSINLTLALSNYSGSAGPLQESYGISARSLTCPAGQYRSSVSRLCTPCTICPQESNETSPCTENSDRVCGASLTVGFRVEGASFLSNFKAPEGLAVSPVVSDDIQVIVQAIPCANDQFRSPEDQLCHPCSVCAPGDIQLRACTASGDRVCSNSVAFSLEIAGSTSVDPQGIDLTQLKARLASALAYSQPDRKSVV